MCEMEGKENDNGIFGRMVIGAILTAHNRVYQGSFEASEQAENVHEKIEQIDRELNEIWPYQCNISHGHLVAVFFRTGTKKHSHRSCDLLHVDYVTVMSGTYDKCRRCDKRDKA